MAGRVRAHDWAATPLGAAAHWPQSLKTAAEIVLASGRAMQLAWGPEHTILYNDAYAPMLGDRHPGALGIPLSEAWPDVWADIEPLVARVLDGETVTYEAMPLATTMRGVREETWWNFSFSPLRDDTGAITGLLNVTIDDSARVRAENALRAREERLRALVTAGTYVIYRMGPDWRLMYQLDSCSLVPTHEPIEDWTDKYIPVEDLPRVYAAIEEAIRTKSLFELEHRVMLADGGIGWVLSRAIPLIGQDGEISEWFGTGSDVTERRGAAEKLRESEDRFRTMADNAPVLIWETDDTGVTSVNGHYLAFFGFDLAEIVGFGWAKFLHPDDAEGYLAAFREAFDRRKPYAFQCRFRRKDGRYRWLRSSGGPVGDNRYVGCSLDVTGLLEAQRSWRESEEQQRLMIELVPALLWWADPVEPAVTVTDRWRSYTGQSDLETRAFGWLDAIHPEDRAATRAAFARAFASGEPLEIQQRIYRAGNGYRWHLVRHVPVRDETGTIARWFGAAIDVHELRELQDSQHVLVAELQHRTRNLLGVVRAMADKTIDRSADLADFRTRYLDRLSALTRVQNLLSRLVDDRRITFDELLRSEIAALDGGDDKVTMDGPPGVALRSSTVQTFALALHELATNAVKYGAFAHDGGTLDIRWRLQRESGSQPWLHVDWRERGVVIPAGATRLRSGGSGRELIERALPYQLRAKTTFVMEGDGIHCTIALPVSERQTGSGMVDG